MEQTVIMCGLEGIIGGIMAEVAGLYQLRRATKSDRPEYLHSGFYWIITTLMVMSGGALAILYQSSGASLNPIVAVNVGASAPLIIQLFSSAAPAQLKVN